MASIADEKAAARKMAFAARKAAFDQGHDGTDHLVGLLDGIAGNVIAGYWPIRTEIDPRAAMERLSADKAIVLPVVAGDGLPLDFRFWVPGCDMIEGAFGAAIPADERGADPDILIVPLVAFDGQGYRLGYGGGFYDRTIERLKKSKPVVTVGFAFSAQQIDRVPTEPTDQHLDYMVTEDGVLSF